MENLFQTGNPYQNLANAIVMMAANDYRKAALYLEANEEPPELRDFLSDEEISRFLGNEQDRQAIRRGASYQRYYRASNRFMDAQATMIACKKFFLGPWMEMLTDLDGDALLERLDKEISRESEDSMVE